MLDFVITQTFLTIHTFFFLCGSQTLEIGDHYVHEIFVLEIFTLRDHYLSAQPWSLTPRVSRELNL